MSFFETSQTPVCISINLPQPWPCLPASSLRTQPSHFSWSCFFFSESPTRYDTLFYSSPVFPSAGSLLAAHKCALVIACKSSPLPPPLRHPVSASRHICTSGKTGQGTGSALHLSCRLPSVPASFLPDAVLHLAWTTPIVP